MSRETTTDNSAFMAQLLMPVLDADLRDPELERLERRAAKEAKARVGRTFHTAMRRVWAARALWDYRRWADFSMAEMRAAELAFYAAVANVMPVPAGSAAQFRMKESLRKVGGREADFLPLLEAEAKRLGVKFKGGRK